MNILENIFRDNEIAFQGTPLTPGIARGRAYLLKKVDLERFRNDKRTVNLISSELARFDFAVTRSKNQIANFMHGSLQGTLDKSYPIFETENHLLHDPATVSSIKETIGRTALNGESVLAEEIALLRDNAVTCTEELTVKSLITLQDLYYRILYNMLFSDEDRISAIMKIPAGSILVADRLTPVEIAVIPVDKVAGILIEESTRSSHASIMAQTMGLPVIIDFPGIGSLLNESTDVLIDACRGIVFLNPSDATVKECQDMEVCNAAAQLPALPGDASTVYSADNVEIRLLCNASTLKDIVHAHSQGIAQIGLFRSEIRYLSGTVIPTVEQDAAYYAGIFGVEGIACMTVRLLDMGGDKLPVFLQMEKETDPQLGCRGIRFLLSHPDIMKNQIRAILTARSTFRVRLLLPFVTTVEDLLMARRIFDEVVSEMNISGDLPNIGIMVEVPSVAMSIAQFLPKVDFVCLGTNDLLQYFFAVNRDQAELRKYNRFTHPTFLKIIEEVITACKDTETQCTICGEMTSDPIGCSLLVAAGATSLSVQPDSIPIVRKAISKLKVGALRTMLPEIFDLESADEVEQRIRILGVG